MSDMPGGEYTAAIIGGLWPATGHGVLTANSSKRQADASYHEDMASARKRARCSTLASEKGVTAECAMQSNNVGEVAHRKASDNHREKAGAWGRVGDVVSQVKKDLADIASRANERIREVQRSKAKEPVKIAKITEIVAAARAEAIAKATSVVGEITDEAGRLLTKTGQSKTVDDLVKALDVKHKLDMPKPDSSFSPPDVIEPSDDHHYASPLGNKDGSMAPPDVKQGVGWDAGTKNSSFEPPKAGGTGGIGVGSAAGVGIGAPAGGVPAGGGLPAGGSVPRVPSVPAAGVPGGGGLPGGLSQALNPGNVIKSMGSAVSPENLASGFQAGMRAGGPAASQASSLTNALSGMGGGHASPAPIQNVPSGGVSAAPTVSVPHAVAPQEVAVAPTAQPSHAAPAAPASYVAPVQAGPAAPVAPVTGGGAGGGGALPAYGSDVRVSPTSNLVPPSAGSAPIGGSVSTAPSGGSGVGSPSVVRQAPAAAAAGTSSPLASALAAPAAGAAAGAVTGTAGRLAVEQGRCDDLVAAVARQEPRVRWGAATRSDGSTLLVTDLAGGWIPPHVKTPEGVTLVSPRAAMWAPRRPLVDMLGENLFQSVYEPGAEIAEASVPLSDWVRHVEDVSDMRWSLRKASEWRDGLPRLAHTMAKAWATNAGVRPIEVDQLREHLNATRTAVLGDYAGGIVNGHVLGNWMLLAAIDALVAGDSVSGTYHYRWFEALRQADVAVSSATG